MSFAWKRRYYVKEGLGEMLVYERRALLRIFLGPAIKFGFRPAFDGAGWYIVQHPADPLVLAEKENAFTAMAYLRECDPSLMPVKYP